LFGLSPIEPCVKWGIYKLSWLEFIERRCSNGSRFADDNNNPPSNCSSDCLCCKCSLFIVSWLL
jgi:hypothetical protein